MLDSLKTGQGYASLLRPFAEPAGEKEHRGGGNGNIARTCGQNNRGSGDAASFAVISPIRHHGQHDIVKVFLEFKHELDAGDFVGDAEVNGLGGTDKIHRPGWLTRPVANIFYVQARLFLLKQNPHCYGSFSAAFSQSEARLYTTHLGSDLLAAIREGCYPLETHKAMIF